MKLCLALYWNGSPKVLSPIWRVVEEHLRRACLFAMIPHVEDQKLFLIAGHLLFMLLYLAGERDILKLTLVSTR